MSVMRSLMSLDGGADAAGSADEAQTVPRLDVLTVKTTVPAKQVRVKLESDMNGFYVPVADERYEVYSHGNGWAYEIVDVRTGRSLWVQDHEADELREATRDFEDLSCVPEYMEVLGYRA
jgi:hypothetical protein